MKTTTLELVGAACFGVVVGWVTYRTLRRRGGGAELGDIASVIGAVGGAAVTTLFSSGKVFGLYCIGLAIGFFGYLVTALILEGRRSVADWMGADDRGGPRTAGSGDKLRQ